MEIAKDGREMVTRGNHVAERMTSLLPDPLHDRIDEQLNIHASKSLLSPAEDSG